MASFRYVDVTETPTVLAGLTDDIDYAGQNSPPDTGSQVNQPPIFYTKQPDADDPPANDSDERAIILPFSTGQFSPEAGMTFYVWTPVGTTKLVLVDR